MDVNLTQIREYLRGLYLAARRKARPFLGPVYRPARSVVLFLPWLIPALGKLVSGESERRLLMIYDTSSQPYSIGDFLIMQEAAIVLREKHRLDLVDFALVCDGRKPAPSDPAFAGINKGNALYHLASILPVAQINEHLGSVFIFDSKAQLHRHISDNASAYQVWPTAWQFATRQYLHYAIFNDLLMDHFKAHGSLPRLTCRSFLVEWAQRFHREHVFPAVPVTVNLRNNKNHHPDRNSNLDCWLEFFRHCETRYPVKFIVICARSEIDERLERCANVIIAKEFHSGIEEDLALIHTAAMHMGAGSGPVSMAWFNSKPYLMVNTRFERGYAHPGMIIQEEVDIQRFWFAGPMQRISPRPETVDLLVRQFALMWATIDLKFWESQAGISPDAVNATEKLWLR